MDESVMQNMTICEKCRKKQEKYIFLKKSLRKIWWNEKFIVPLHSHLRNNVCDSEMSPTGKVG